MTLRWTGVAAAAAVIVTFLAPGTAEAATPATYDDFNGDGYRDLAVGAPNATVSGKYGAGAVVIFWGSASGVTSTKRTVLTQNSPGVPGDAEMTDAFGSAITSADLDGDGRTDLLVSTEREAIGTQQGIGTVTVLWGSSSGFTSGANLPRPAVREWANFGRAVTAGDFYGSAGVDVTVTSRDGTYHYQGPFTRKGIPVSRDWDPLFGTTDNAISGDLTGDGRPERVVLPGSVDGDLNGDVYVDRWVGGEQVRTELPNADGMVGAIGDINRDGYGDLVLGAPYEPDATSPGGSRGGQISVWYGGPEGPSTSQRPVVIHQDTAGVPNGSETGDRFGSSVSVGDINGDGFADVAVGAWSEDLPGGKRDAGTVTVLYGSAAGLTTNSATTLSQDSAGVPGAAEKDDAFGLDVRLSDLNKDNRAELSIGGPGENGWGGAIAVLRGTTSGVGTSGAMSVGAKGAGVSGSDAWFGHVLNR